MLPYGCYLECGNNLSDRRKDQIRAFLAGLELDWDDGVDFTAVICSAEDQILATASLERNLIKCVGVSRNRQGEGLTAPLMTCLLEQCAKRGISGQLLYTKPQNGLMFQEFGFSRIAWSHDAILLERPAGELDAFLSQLPKAPLGAKIGAVVVHCNPITNGHLYLIDEAMRRCGFLYVFVISEDRGEVPAADRLRLVQEALTGRSGIAVCPTGPYLISQATFPAYFLRNAERVQTAWGELDARIFGQRFAPALGISQRFVGTEPLSPVTAAYNQQLKTLLPAFGVTVTELERKTAGGSVISASRVRQLVRQGRVKEIAELVPPCTLRYFSDPITSVEAMRRLTT